MKTSLFFILFPVLVWAQNPTPKKILALGDSLTEGYGVARERAYPALLEAKLKNVGFNWVVINSGISGSTTASAKGRLQWQLKNKPDVIFLALGANDGLRGLKVADSEKNLSEAILLAQNSKVKIILAEMLMPPNYGETYRKEFQNMYSRLAKKHQIPLIPFFLKDIAGKPELNLPDGIHPNEKGYQIVAEYLFQQLKGHL
ncbi:MAG: arylesterase [Pseudobdellovibrionaceae bacterium]